MNELTGLSTFCGKINIPGISKIEYAPVDWIDARFQRSLVTSSYNQNVDLVFSRGGWLTAPVINSKRLWTEQQQITEQGESYRQTVRGVVPGLSAEAAGELNETARHRYLLRLTDRYGKKWLLGTLDSPFDFSADGSTSEVGGVRGHEIRFESETAQKAYGFEPAVVL